MAEDVLIQHQLTKFSVQSAGILFGENKAQHSVLTKEKKSVSCSFIHEVQIHLLS